ncbi:MAG: cyclophilin-like fold protein [Haloarculaceae archaeon]
MSELTVTVDGHELSANWTEDNPETRAAIADALPVSGNATRWGEELYFSIPVEVPPERTREEVPVGAVAYWPQGNALCLFWGPTPASQGDEPRAAGPVTVVGQLDDVSALRAVDGGATVRVESTG